MYDDASFSEPAANSVTRCRTIPARHELAGNDDESSGGSELVVELGRQGEVSAATGRSVRPTPTMAVLEPGGVQVDATTGRYVTSDGSRGRLTAVERVMLVALLSRRGETVTREGLFAAAHGGALPDPSGLRSVDQAVSRLRRRLFKVPGGIVAVRGQGYRLASAGGAAPALSAIVGRDTELAVIEAQLAPHRRPPQRVELVGAGGIGKTSIAREILRRAQERGEPTMWVALGGASLDEGQLLTVLAQALSLVAGHGRDPATLRAAIEARMIQHAHGERLLVVFDDVDGAHAAVADLTAHSTTFSQARVLVTARRKTSLLALQGHAIGPLSVADAVTMLTTRAYADRGPPSAEEVGLIQAAAEALGGWPLALELAAARLHQSPPDEVPRQLAALAEAGGRDLATLDAGLRAMWAALAEDERAVLRLVALGGGDVPQGVLHPSGLIDAASTGHLTELYRTGWLHARRAEGRVELHALVRDFVLKQVEPAHRERYCELLAAHADRLWGLPLSNDPRVTHELASVAPLLVIAIGLTDAADVQARLTLGLGRHYLLSGPRERAIDTARALDALIPLVDVERRAALHVMRAWLLVVTREGDAGAADALANLALARSPEHRGDALALVARTHRHLPELAEQALREALSLRLGPLEKAKAQAVLASFLTREERFDEALAPMMRAIEALETLNVETRYAQENYLGVILAECGASRQARRVFEAAEAAYTRLSKGASRAGFVATRALLALDGGDAALADKLLERLVQSADRGGRPSLSAIAAVWLVATALMQGQNGQARERLAVLRANDRVSALATPDRAFFHALAGLLANDDEVEAELDMARSLLGRRYPATTYVVATVAHARLGSPLAEPAPSGVRVRVIDRLVRA